MNKPVPASPTQISDEQAVKAVYPGAHMSSPNGFDAEEIYSGNGVIRTSWLGRDYADARSRLEPAK